MMIQPAIRIFLVIGLIGSLGIGMATSTITSYVSLTPVDFIGQMNMIDDGYSMYVNLDIMYRAPLQLPNGATISKITIYYIDNSEPYDLLMNLERTAYDGVPHIEGTVTSSGYSTLQTSNSISTSVLVDNSSNGYFLRFQTPGGMGSVSRFYGAIVEYTLPFYTSFLSLIIK
jgi:hypothetical protein